MSEYNGATTRGHKADCLTQDEFEKFLSDKWQPHSTKIEGTMERLASSIDQMVGIFKWAAKGLLALLCMLVLVVASFAIIQLLRDSGVSFKGNLGGEHGAAIELHQERGK